MVQILKVFGNLCRDSKKKRKNAIQKGGSEYFFSFLQYVLKFVNLEQMVFIALACQYLQL